MATQNLDSTDMPTPICSLCGSRRPDEYIQGGEYQDGDMKFPLFECLTCGGEVEWS